MAVLMVVLMAIPKVTVTDTLLARKGRNKMKKRHDHLKFLFFSFTVFIIALWAISNTQALENNEDPDSLPQTESENLGSGGLSGAPLEPGQIIEKPNAPEYAQGELIVKLKSGKSLDDIKELNTKYNVTSTEKIFKEQPSPENTLKQDQDKSAKLDSKHDSWYWQLDKNSKEYNDYKGKLEKEKQNLKSQIQTQGKFGTPLNVGQNIAPQEAVTPELGNTYLLKTANAATDIHLMIADYQSNPAVEYAEPNYIANIQKVPDNHY